MMRATLLHPLLLLLLAAAPLLINSTLTPSTFQVVEGSEVAALSSLHEVTFAVQQRNLDKLEDALVDVSTPGLTNYGRHWSRQAVADLTAPSSESISAVLTFLEAQPGVNITLKTQYGEYISAVAPIQTWNTVFKTTFRLFQCSVTNRTVLRARHEEFFLPTNLSDHVVHVLNAKFVPALLSMHEGPVHSRMVPTDNDNSSPLPIFNANSKKEFSGYVTPATLNRVYSVTNNTASPAVSQCVYSGIGQQFSLTDLTTFASKLVSNKTIPVVTEFTSGGAELRVSESVCKKTPDSCIENNLDLQYMYGMAQGAALQNWYDYANDQFSSWIVSVAAAAKPPNVISISYGISELALIADSTGTAAIHADLFDIEAKKLGLQGTTILVSSGDHGSIGNLFNSHNLCALDVSWPASSPWVLGVGATLGPESASQEVTCSATYGSAITSGGGFSFVYSRPSWQGLATHYLDATKQVFAGNKYLPISPAIPTRGVPDVSLLGNAFITLVGGNLTIVSGTSASCPALAGMLTLINSRRHSLGLSSLGWINPTLYSAAANGALYPLLFNDITIGSNNNYYNASSDRSVVCSQGWAAAPGWDPSTGLGTPFFPALSAYLTSAATWAQYMADGGHSLAPSPAPTAAAVILQVVFTISGISFASVTATVTLQVKAVLATALFVPVSSISNFDISAGTAAGTLTELRLSTLRQRLLLSAPGGSSIQVTATVGAPTAADAAAVTSAVAVLPAKFAKTYQDAFNVKVTVSNVQLTNVTPGVAQSPASSSEPNMAAVIGGTVGGAAFLLAIVVRIAVMWRRKQESTAQSVQTVVPVSVPSHGEHESI